MTPFNCLSIIQLTYLYREYRNRVYSFTNTAKAALVRGRYLTVSLRLVKDVVVLLRPLQKGYYIVVPQKVSQIPPPPFWCSYLENLLLDLRRQLRQQETIQQLDTPHSNQHSIVVDNTTYRWVAKVAIVSATRSVWP